MPFRSPTPATAGGPDRDDRDRGAPQADVPSHEVPEHDVPEQDVPEHEVPAHDVADRDSPEADSPEAGSPEADSPGDDSPGDDVAESDVPGPCVAALDDIPSRTLYALLRLRVDVFVVEQECPYPELDGRDTEPDTRHLWITADGSGDPVAYLRVLEEPGGVARIGRVVVARRARGAGHAGRLLRSALTLIGERDCVLGAQAHLEAFYGGFGFVRTGPEYLEDGIPHVPMRRTVRPAG